MEKGFSINGNKLGCPTIDFVGRRFGMLTVEKCIEVSKGDVNKRGTWLCRCECGNTIEVKGKNLVSKKGGKNCGCINQLSVILKGKPNYKLRTPRSLENKQYNSHRFNAISRNYTPLSKDTWLSIVKQSCYYCGEIDERSVIPSPSITSAIRYRNFTEDELKNYQGSLNGVDRLDNSVGYEPYNCVSCCKQCNTMKMNFTEQEFYNKVNLIQINKQYGNVSVESFLCN